MAGEGYVVVAWCSDETLSKIVSLHSTTLPGNGDQKLLPQTGIDPMPLAFEASVLACFRGKHGTEPVPLAFKASVIPKFQCTIGATLL